MQSEILSNLRMFAGRRITSVGSFTRRSMSDSSSQSKSDDLRSKYYPNTSFGIKERSIKSDKEPPKPILTGFPPFPDGKNPKTGEVGGPAGPEPTVYGDWQRKGRVTDF